MKEGAACMMQKRNTHIVLSQNVNGGTNWNSRHCWKNRIRIDKWEIVYEVLPGLNSHK
jgi:hypothetical protein